jgi:hypothetical protein
MSDENVSEVTLDHYRRAAQKSDSVLMPDGRKFRIVWAEFDAYGVRNPVTGEQYMIRHEETRDLNLQLLIHCPIDVSRA